MYGGIKESGAIADKLWYFDSTKMMGGLTYSLRFKDVNTSTWDSALFRTALFTDWASGGFGCNPATTLYIYATHDEKPDPPGGVQHMRVDISIDPSFTFNFYQQVEDPPDSGTWISPPCVPVVEDALTWNENALSWGVPAKPSQRWREHWAEFAPRLFNGATPTPKPQTPNPKPQIRNPKPQTSNPKPQTPNPKPQTQ